MLRDSSAYILEQSSAFEILSEPVRIGSSLKFVLFLWLLFEITEEKLESLNSVLEFTEIKLNKF